MIKNMIAKIYISHYYHYEIVNIPHIGPNMKYIDIYYTRT